MKTTISAIILLLSALLTNAISQQHCAPSGVVFSTQQSIDLFPVNYPGCTIIDGNLAITGGAHNLDGLSQITAVGGDILIAADSISNMTGLSGLTSIVAP